jgi:hypothetical protein
MKHKTSIAVVGRRALSVATLVGALVALVGSPVLADSDESTHSAPLVGVWIVQVTIRNCDTNAPLGPAFGSLVTFHEGGTLSEAPGGVAFAPGQRSPGHGTWTRLSAHRYRQSMVALILFDTPANLPGTPGFNPSVPVSPGLRAGWQTVTHTVRLSDADHLTSAGGNEFLDGNGDVYRAGCSTAVAQRFE